MKRNPRRGRMVDPDPGITSNRLFSVSPINTNELREVGSVDFDNTMTQRYTAPWNSSTWS